MAVQIDWEPEVTSRDISVAARDGVITLTGFVYKYYEKAAAERAARPLCGVKAMVPEDVIRVTVRDGRVTL